MSILLIDTPISVYHSDGLVHVRVFSGGSALTLALSAAQTDALIPQLMDAWEAVRSRKTPAEPPVLTE